MCEHINKDYKYRIPDTEIPVPDKIWICKDCLEEGSEPVPPEELTDYEKTVMIKIALNP